MLERLADVLALLRLALLALGDRLILGLDGVVLGAERGEVGGLRLHLLLLLLHLRVELAQLPL